MIVLAVDPGFGRLGLAVLEKTKSKHLLLYSACVVTDSKLSLPERLVIIAKELKLLLKKYPLDCVVLEKLYFAKNKTTALRVAEVRGVILELAAQNGLGVVEYSPAEIKVAVTGYGAATKAQVETMVRRLIYVPEGKKHDDEIDAIATGLTHLASWR